MKKQNENTGGETKQRLLDAGASLMRERGFNGTSLDDICAAAGVTKGGFFHYFKGKADIAKAALTQFAQERATMSGTAPFNQLPDPFDRVVGRIEFAKHAATGGGVTKGCLIGTLAQELAFTNPELRAACDDAFKEIKETFTKDLAEAKALYAPKSNFDPKDFVGLYVSIVQGGMLMAKTSQDNDIIVTNLQQLRNYAELLFGRTASIPSKKPSKALNNSRN